MRIGSISQVAQVYQTQSRNVKTNTSYQSQMDAYSVSSTGKDYQTAKAALASTPDVRQDKVDSLKQSINDGSYNVDLGDFASHLIASYNNRTI